MLHAAALSELRLHLESLLAMKQQLKDAVLPSRTQKLIWCVRSGFVAWPMQKDLDG